MEERKNKSFGIKYFLGGVLVTCLVVAVLYFVAMWLPLGGAPGKPDKSGGTVYTYKIQRAAGFHERPAACQSGVSDSASGGIDTRYGHRFCRESVHNQKASEGLKRNFLGRRDIPPSFVLYND